MQITIHVVNADPIVFQLGVASLNLEDLLWSNKDADEIIYIYIDLYRSIYLSI